MRVTHTSGSPLRRRGRWPRWGTTGQGGERLWGKGDACGDRCPAAQHPRHTTLHHTHAPRGAPQPEVDNEAAGRRRAGGSRKACSVGGGMGQGQGEGSKAGSRSARSFRHLQQWRWAVGRDVCTPLRPSGRRGRQTAHDRRGCSPRRSYAASQHMTGVGVRPSGPPAGVGEEQGRIEGKGRQHIQRAWVLDPPGLLQE